MSRLDQRKAGAAATPGSTVVSASGGGLSLATYGVVGAAVGVWGAVVNAAATDPARRLQLTERAGAWAGGSHAVRGGVWIHAASIGEVKLAGRAGSRIRRTHSDLPLLLTCNTPTGRAAAAAVFTRNKVAAAPVRLGRQMLTQSSQYRGIIANSGNANACTGEYGMADSQAMQVLAAREIGRGPGEVFVC